MQNKLQWLGQYNVSPKAIKQIVVNQSNNKRRLANTKVRSEINKTNKKAYKQKGTGNARRGQMSSPILVKGGKAMGPRFHIVHKKDNKKLCQNVRLTILNKHLEKNNIHIMSIEMQQPSTKSAVTLLNSIDINYKLKRTIVILNDYDMNIRLSFNNLYNVKVVSVININTIDLINAHKVIITPDAIEYLTNKYGDRSEK